MPAQRTRPLNTGCAWSVRIRRICKLCSWLEVYSVEAALSGSRPPSTNANRYFFNNLLEFVTFRDVKILFRPIDGGQTTAA
jgi:hypothetical protein